MRQLAMLLSGLALVSALVGCSPSAEKPPVAQEPTAPTTANAAPNPNAGGVAPMASGAAGGMTPMAGAESVQGGGGFGAGAAAKGMANRAAAQAQGGSMQSLEGTE